MGAPVTLEGKSTVGMTSTVPVTFVRPNDSTQYTAGDVVSSTSTAGVAPMLKFLNVARFAGGGGILQSAVLIDSVAAATKPDLELYLFTNVIVMQSDNAVWAPTDAEMTYFVGVVAFPTGAFKTAGANGIIDVTGLGMAFNCAADRQDLYGVLVARNAYTPTALEQFTIQLQILQD
jgi:hypothetical protein